MAFHKQNHSGTFFLFFNSKIWFMKNFPLKNRSATRSAPLQHFFGETATAPLRYTIFLERPLTAPLRYTFFLGILNPGSIKSDVSLVDCMQIRIFGSLVAQNWRKIRQKSAKITKIRKKSEKIENFKIKSSRPKIIFLTLGTQKSG